MPVGTAQELQKCEEKLKRVPKGPFREQYKDGNFEACVQDGILSKITAPRIPQDPDDQEESEPETLFGLTKRNSQKLP